MITSFMYHDIRDSKEYKKRYDLKSFLNVSDFKKHIKYIKKKYKVIKTSEIIDNLYTKDKLAVLTFDDGLKDHYDITEILLDNQITGTFLIPTLPITDGKMIHSHKIQFIMACEEESIVVKMILDMVNEPNIYDTYSVTMVKNNWWSKDMVFITNFLRYGDKDKSITNHLFNNIVTKDEKDFSSNFYLNQNQVKEMINSSMEIGGHGYTSDILNNDNMIEELDKSIDFIRTFHNDEFIFSYPNGKFSDAVISYLKKKKCKFAYTTESKNMYNNDLLRIPRFDAPQTIIL